MPDNNIPAKPLQIDESKLKVCSPPNSAINCIDYTQGFLTSQIGREVKVEFLIGTNLLVDRQGTLVKVGANYIIIQEAQSDDYLLCDLYSIKFVKFYY